MWENSMIKVSTVRDKKCYYVPLLFVQKMMFRKWVGKPIVVPKKRDMYAESYSLTIFNESFIELQTMSKSLFSETIYYRLN